MKHSIRRDKQAISYHYDVSNKFYDLFLGREKVYSCAYFKTGEEDLDEAQENKLDHICRKLRLKPGERLLDIGCGWGGLICYAARQYGVKATGITLSRQQYEYAAEKIYRSRLSGACRVELKDYRQLEAADHYDKVVSVGMFEHVGLKNLPLYFRACRRVMKPDGLFLNHGIVSEANLKRDSAGTKFINAYVFPDGELASISVIIQRLEDSGFEIVDLEALREHYARTLIFWTNNLKARSKEAIEIAGEKTYRTWLIYMAGCAWGFEKGNIGIYQILLSKKRGGFAPVPLTRQDIYRQDKLDLL